MMCWMCDPRQYTFIEHSDFRVSRLVFEDDNTFVVVPHESHVKYHLLVVLKSQDTQHKSGLIECSKSDLAALGSTIVKCCQTLKRMGYDTVYTGCYSDSGHAHFHLIPLKFAFDKGYSGKAMKWLADKEENAGRKRFKNLYTAGKLG